jgi:hypothetical protein
MKRTGCLFSVAILIMFLFLNDIVASVPPGIGVVVSTRGQVTAIDKAHKSRGLNRGATIYLHDRIITPEDGKAQLRLQDDSIIVLQPGSEFYVSEFHFNKNAPRDTKYVGNIVKGMLINISGQGEAKNYRLDSPLTTIAFRGTGLATKLIEQNNVLTDQEIYVFQGYIAVTNRCERLAEISGKCYARTVDIGAGEKANSIAVNVAGKIRMFNSSGISAESGGG